MREQVVNFFQSLPDEGIAVHGTNLARAKSIKETGLLPDSLVGLDSDVWYNVQPPNLNRTLYHDIRREINSLVVEAVQRAYAATNPNYSFGGSPESRTPALVVFKPNEKFARSSLAVKLTPYPMTSKSSAPIPSENVLGILELNRTQSMKRFTSVVLGQIVNLITGPQTPKRE